MNVFTSYHTFYLLVRTVNRNGCYLYICTCTLYSMHICLGKQQQKLPTLRYVKSTTIIL